MSFFYIPPGRGGGGGGVLPPDPKFNATVLPTRSGQIIMSRKQPDGSIVFKTVEPVFDNQGRAVLDEAGIWVSGEP